MVSLVPDPSSGQDTYVASHLGQAVVSSGLAPEEGLKIFVELQRSCRCFVLENDLHLVYLVGCLLLSNDDDDVDDDVGDDYGDDDDGDYDDDDDDDYDDDVADIVVDDDGDDDDGVDSNIDDDDDDDEDDDDDDGCSCH